MKLRSKLVLATAAMAGAISAGAFLHAQDGPRKVDATKAQPAASTGAGANAPQTQRAQAEVPVKIVVLFSSGVGYFEHFGTVKGEGTTELRFKTQQINDILKSLVLQDLDGGKVAAVTYPSQDPVAKTLRSFQVDITANPSLAELLNQLRGAKVSINAGAESLQGTVLGVEKKQRPVGDAKDAKPIEVSVMNLLTDNGIRSVQLDDVRNLQIEDAQLRDELQRALSALAQARDQDKKPISISFRGQGERRVRLGYVVEAPVWKTSYRLILSDQQDVANANKKNPDRAGPVGAQPRVPSPPREGNVAEKSPLPGDGKLQGWAIIENQTDGDWNDVQLSLVSGRPISFIQNLYQPLYIPRPVVQPQLYASLTPQTYEGGMAVLKDAPAEFSPLAAMSAPAARPEALRERMAGRAPAGAAGGFGGGGGLSQNAEGAEVEAREAKLGAIDAASSVASVASAVKVGELFQYTVGNVSLPRQKSAMIPVVTDDVQVERLSIYNQSVLPRNPLNGARVRNTTGKHLLQGPVTVLDGGAYAGDARIDDVPPGQERLLSYGIDQQLIVNATKNREDSAIQTGKIGKGVLELTNKQVFTQEYVNENKADKDKTLLIEHPIRQGWKLVEPAKADESTEAVYRFKGTVPARKQSRLAVKQEVITGQQIAILPCDVGQLEFYSKAGEIPRNVRDALGKAVGMKYGLVDSQRQIQQRQQRIAQISQEQNRIRENMKTVGSNTKSEYYTRLLTKLNEQETAIEKVQTEIETLQEKSRQQQKDLEDYLAGLTVG